MGLRFLPFPGLSSSGKQVLGEHTLPRWGSVSYHLPGPSCLVFWVCSRSTISGVPCVSSGELISGCDPPGDVNCPESQELNGACLQCGRGCLSGAEIAPFQLWLPTSPPAPPHLACFYLAGDGPARSLLALLWCSLSPLFCERAWQCLSLGLFAG